MKYELSPSNQFKKDVRLAEKRGYDLMRLKAVIAMLADGEALPQKYKDHLLTGCFSGFRECHITPDWLLVYQISEQMLILYLTRTGTHSDLF